MRLISLIGFQDLRYAASYIVNHDAMCSLRDGGDTHIVDLYLDSNEDVFELFLLK